MYLPFATVVSGLALALSLFQPVLSAVHLEHGHKHALRGGGLQLNYAHGNFHRRRNPGIAKRDAATAQLQTEVNAFSTWMDDFFNSKTAFNTQEAVAKVNDEMKVHGQAMKAFLTAAGATIPATNVAQLQQEVHVFQTWADAWAKTATIVDSNAALGLLKQDVTAYQVWLKAWITSNAGSSSGAAPAPEAPPVQSPPSPAPIPASPAPAPEAPPAPSPAPSPAAGGEFHEKPSPAPEEPEAPAPGTAPVSPPAASEHTPASSPVAEPQPKQTIELPPAAPKPQPQPGSSGGFNAGGTSNLAAWWGASGATGAVGIDRLCSDPSYDIVILSFLSDFFGGPGGQPVLNFGAGGDASTLGDKVKACQAAGKKVMLSMGGATAKSDFASDQQAEQFADLVWNLFLGGTSSSRPFGQGIQLDGIDIDNESHNPTGYTAFTKSLRQKISSSQRPYYISAAPQCPRPDASIPLDAMHMMDFVWVQFYNNGPCNHGESGFIDSLQAWSKDLSSGSGKGPKLYVAAIADTNQGKGFIDASALGAEMAQVKALNLPNFGGYALWDGSLAIANNMVTSVKNKLVAR